jgi:hypothetical protein
MAYIAPVPFGISLNGQTERQWGQLVTPSYFSTLGVRPALGRFFDTEERPGAVTPMVVSYRFWQEHLASDPSAIGRTFRVNSQPVTIIGVGPREFLGASPLLFAADLWMPLSAGERVARTLRQPAGAPRPPHLPWSAAYVLASPRRAWRPNWMPPRSKLNRRTAIPQARRRAGAYSWWKVANSCL